MKEQKFDVLIMFSFVSATSYKGAYQIWNLFQVEISANPRDVYKLNSFVMFSGYSYIRTDSRHPTLLPRQELLSMYVVNQKVLFYCIIHNEQHGVIVHSLNLCTICNGAVTSTCSVPDCIA